LDALRRWFEGSSRRQPPKRVTGISKKLVKDRLTEYVVGFVIGPPGMSREEIREQIVLGESAANAGMRARLHLSLYEREVKPRKRVVFKVWGKGGKRRSVSFFGR